MIGGTGSYGMETAWIIEESGISSTVDVSASNFGAFGTTGDSGTTLPTTHSNEFVAACVAGSNINGASSAQSASTNSFGLGDGTSRGWGIAIKLVYICCVLTKTVSSTGAQNVKTTFANSAYWEGAIVTFALLSSPTQTPTPAPTPTPVPTPSLRLAQLQRQVLFKLLWVLVMLLLEHSRCLFRKYLQAATYSFCF